MPQPEAVMSILLCPQDLRFEKPWHVTKGSRSVPPFPPPPSQSFPPQSFPPIQFLGAPERVHNFVPPPRCCYTQGVLGTPPGILSNLPRSPAQQSESHFATLETEAGQAKRPTHSHLPGKWRNWRPQSQFLVSYKILLRAAFQSQKCYLLIPPGGSHSFRNYCQLSRQQVAR